MPYSHKPYNHKPHNNRKPHYHQKSHKSLKPHHKQENQKPQNRIIINRKIISHIIINQYNHKPHLHHYAQELIQATVKCRLTAKCNYL